MAERERELAKLDTPDLQDIVRTVQGETLRDVAKRVYGSAKDWLLIAKYNGFASLSNAPIWYMGLVLARAQTRWDAKGMLLTESGMGILGIGAFAAVAVAGAARGDEHHGNEERSEARQHAAR